MFKPLSLRVICHTELEADAGHRACPDHRRRKGQQVQREGRTRCAVGKSQGASQGDLWSPKGCSSDGQLMPGLPKTACSNLQKHDHQVT